MNILIVDNDTKHVSNVIDLFCEHKIDIVHYTQRIDPDRYDFYILSGWWHYSVFHHPYPYEQQIDFVQHTSKPVLGICLGAQIIAQAFGSKIYKLDQKRRGILSLEFEKNRMKFLSLISMRYNIWGKNSSLWHVAKTGKRYLRIDLSLFEGHNFILKQNHCQTLVINYYLGFWLKEDWNYFPRSRPHRKLWFICI